MFLFQIFRSPNFHLLLESLKFSIEVTEPAEHETDSSSLVEINDMNLEENSNEFLKDLILLSETQSKLPSLESTFPFSVTGYETNVEFQPVFSMRKSNSFPMFFQRQCSESKGIYQWSLGKADIGREKLNNHGSSLTDLQNLKSKQTLDILEDEVDSPMKKSNSFPLFFLQQHSERIGVYQWPFGDAHTGSKKLKTYAESSSLTDLQKLRNKKTSSVFQQKRNSFPNFFVRSLSFQMQQNIPPDSGGKLHRVERELGGNCQAPKQPKMLPESASTHVVGELKILNNPQNFGEHGASLSPVITDDEDEFYSPPEIIDHGDECCKFETINVSV